MKKALILLSLPILLLFPSCTSSPARTASISFYDGENELGSVSGQSNTKIGEEDLAKIESFEVKENFRFDGWYAKSDFSSSSVSIAYYPTFDTVYYAKFSRKVTLTLDPVDGSFEEGTVTSYTGVSGDALPSLPTPVANGNCDFSSWHYTDSDGNDAKFTSKVYPDTDLTLKANYTAWPKLSFVTNVEGYEIPDYQAKAGSSIDLTKVGIDSAKLVKGDMYSFDGWYSSYDESTGVYADPFYFTSMPDHDTTLYARFLEKHSITFVTNVEGYSIPSLVGFEGTDIEAPYGVDNGGTIDYTKFAVSGKYFDGWYSTSDFSGDPYTFSTMPSGDLTLYAKWVVNPVVTVKRIVDGTEASSFHFSLEPGTHFSILDKVEAEGWNDASHKKGAFYLENADGTQGQEILDPSDRTVSKENVTIRYVQESLHVLTVGLIDPFGNDLSSDTASLYASDGSYAASKDALDTEVKKTSALSSASFDYRISYYSSTKALDKELDKSTAILFPYAPTSDTAIYAVVAKKVSFKIVDGASTYTVEGYQGEDLPSEPVRVDSSGNYVLFGNSTSYSAEGGRIQFYYVKDGSTVFFDFSPEKFTSVLGDSVTELRVKYVEYAD